MSIKSHAECYRTCDTPATCMRACQLLEAQRRDTQRRALVTALLSGDMAAWDALFDRLELLED